MKTKIAIIVEIEHEESVDPFDAVDAELDAGTLQDALNDRDGIEVTSALCIACDPISIAEATNESDTTVQS